MLYSEFAKVMTTHRMSRYLTACGGDSRKAMTLYRKNLLISREMFTITPLLAVKNTMYVRQNYGIILQLFRWMNVDEHTLLYGLDHITSVCNGIDIMCPLK